MSLPSPLTVLRHMAKFSSLRPHPAVYTAAESSYTSEIEYNAINFQSSFFLLIIFFIYF